MFRNIHVALSASSGNLRTVLSAAGGQVKAFEKNVESAAKSSDGLGKKMAAGVAIGAIGLGVALGQVVSQAVGFDRAMRNVNSISQLSEGSLRSLGDATRDLAKDPLINQGPTELAEGLYDIASSGFQGAQGLIVLRAAAEAASAGLTTTAVSSRAITSVLNAYGRSAIEVDDISDALFQTVNLGVITFEELATNIGDVVGSAAAAGVPIHDVGAALAAMTLSGVTAAESSTSLNRVLQEFIKPSEALAATLKGLGYESGAMALKTDGLYVVMEKLRTATGGELTAMQQLFPEIRGLRGALALTAAAGENYRKTTEGISSAEGRAGATRKALAQQMKAVGFQFDQFKNKASAMAVEAGTRLLPAVLGLMKGVESLARASMPGLNQAMQMAQPLFRNLAQLGMNIVEVAKEMAAGLAPVAKAFAAIAGGSVLVTLNALAAALASVSGFLADNSGLVQFVALLAALKMASSLAGVALSGAGAAMERILWTTASTTTGMNRVVASFSAVQGAAVGLAIGVTAALSVMARVERQADALAAAVAKDQDLSTWEGLQRAINDNADAMHRFQAAAKEPADGWFGRLDHMAESVWQQMNPFIDNTIAKSDAAVESLAKQGMAWADLGLDTLKNLNGISDATGLTAEQVSILARTLGIDLTKGYDQSAEARERVILHFKKLQTETGLSKESLTDLSSGGVEEMEALAKAAEETAKAVGSAFADAVDIFSDFKLVDEAKLADDAASAADAVVTAAERVRDAEDRLAAARDEAAEAPRRAADEAAAAAERIRDAEDRVANAREAARKAGATPAEVRAVANAERDLARVKAEAARKSPDARDIRGVANAERDLTKARKDAAKAQQDATKADAGRTSAGDQLKAHFEKQLKEAETFARGIAELTRKGLDPSLIARLLKQGPEEAAPVIEALLGKNSETLIGLANKTEAALREVNANAVAFARITQTAISSESDALINDLDMAMKIAAEKMAQGGAATAAAIAAAIGSTEAEVRRVALAYGIGVGDALVGGVHAKTATLGDVVHADVQGIGAIGVDQAAMIGQSIGQAIVYNVQRQTATLASVVAADLAGISTSLGSPLGVVGQTGVPTRAQADGGIVRNAEGDVVYRGPGGLEAHIARRQKIIYGEPETMGEAYIPFAASKRNRSIELWEETGRILGVEPQDYPGVVARADGGVFPRGSMTGSYAPPPQVIVQQAPSAGQSVAINVEAPHDSGLVAQVGLAARVAGWQLSKSGRR